VKSGGFPKSVERERERGEEPRGAFGEGKERDDYITQPGTPCGGPSTRGVGLRKRGSMPKSAREIQKGKKGYWRPKLALK